MTSNTAPAHPHATGVAVYLALYQEKKSKSVFDFLTYSRETRFSFSYAEVVSLIQLIGASNEIDRVSKFDNSLSFGAEQNFLRQIFFEL